MSINHNTPEEISFGEWLRQRRRMLDLTQQALADQVGCARITLRRIESGARKPSKDLAQIMLNKLGVPEIERPQWVLFARGVSGLPIKPSISISDKLLTKLPAPLTSFIGREKEIDQISLLIDGNRLVTLTGPGGVGKTRLAIQSSNQLLSKFKDGVFFVALADDTDANRFVSRVAQQLEVRQAGRPLLENVKDYLRDKHLLLVLDNFEQLVSTAPIVAEMLAGAPQLKILTTSRIALQLHGEREYLVPPLNLPKPGDISVEDLVGSESVSLFLERARGSNSNFTLTRENAPTVAEICRRLDGLPLALELAAARVKLLPPQAILSRLDDRFKLLTSGARDLPIRHQALRNTLEWSYSLLNAEEKSLYARLSIFVGGFSIETAEAVCGAEGKLDILEGLTSLVNNSLLRQEEIDGESRFSMLETIRAYALERLAESGEMESLRERHAIYFGKMVVEQTWPRLASAKALHWLNWLEREYDNIRATLTWCLSVPGGIDLGVQLAFALEWFWYRRGYFLDGRMWCERILASPALKMASLERATTLVSSALMALWLGKPELGLAEAQEALSLGHLHEHEFIINTSNFESAVIFINMGRDRQAQPLLAQAQAFFNEQNLPYFHAQASVHLGNVELGLGNLDRARALHEEALSEARTIGENWLLTFALNNLGEVARTAGQYDLARSYYEECEALLRDTGDTGDLARFVHSLGYIAQHEGNYTRAESQFRKSLAMFRQLGSRRGMAECMAALAGLKARQGNAKWGAIVLSAAESVLKATGGEWWPADRIEVEANQESIRFALSEFELTAAQKKGQAMTLEQALAFALEGQTRS